MLQYNNFNLNKKDAKEHVNMFVFSSFTKKKSYIFHKRAAMDMPPKSCVQTKK